MEQINSKKMPGWVKKFVLISLGFFVLVIIIIILAGGEKTTSQNGATKSQQPSAGRQLGFGDEAMLNFHDNSSDCTEETIVAVDRESEDAVIKAAIAKDDYGMAELVASGKAFLVPNCTKIKVINTEVGVRQIRILEGSQINKAGWVPFEFLK